MRTLYLSLALLSSAASAAGIGARAEVRWEAVPAGKGFELRFDYSRLSGEPGHETATLRLGCGEADAVPIEGLLPWDVVIAVETELEAFLERESAALERLASDESCDWISRQRIREALEARSLAPLLTGIDFDAERYLLDAFRAALAESALPAPIRRDAVDGGKGIRTEVRGEALIVTHASRAFDARGAIREGLDREIDAFRAAGRPVIFLLNDDRLQDFGWLSREREPDLALASRSGEHALRVLSDRVSVAGGFFSLCQARTVGAAADSYFEGGGKGELRIRYALDATYEERHAFLPGASARARERLLRLEGPVTLRALLGAAGARGFARAIPGLHLLDPSRYRVRAAIDGRVIHRWGKGKRRVLLDFRS